MRRPRRAIALGATLLVALGVLSACAPATNAIQDVAPDGITVSIYQNRYGLALGRLEVTIANDTEEPVRITRLELRSDQFAEPGTWTKAPATVMARTSADLPVMVPPPDCSAVDPFMSVEFDYTLASGKAGTAIVEPVDRFDRLPELMREDCFAERVLSVAQFTIEAPPRPRSIGDVEVFDIDVAVTPTASPGTITIVSLAGTTLLAPADPESGVRLVELPVGVTVRGGDEPSMITLTVLPARCDLHAIAEDKRGTIMPLEIWTDDGEGRLLVPSALDVRDRLYELVVETCARTAAPEG